jgi:NAD(P)-dependent dehydrogenase (short-subunit alcohol dehydrogenase family)
MTRSAGTAVIVGAGRPYAETCRAALLQQGLTVSIVDAAAEPVIDPAVDVLVTCPPVISHRAPLAATLTAAVLPAEAWGARFLASCVTQARPGVLVHLSGLAGLGGWPGWEAAGAAYAAINSLMRSTAVAFAPHGIRVNALVLGVDDALAQAIAAASGRSIADICARIPARRLMPEAALANGLSYLVHPSSSYVSGEALVVDGGWDAWGRLPAMAS